MLFSPALFISLGSLLVAAFSVFLTLRLWRKSNRPLVTARISTHSGGNVGITLDILIENSGTRPALDVRLQAREEDIRAAMLSQDEGSDLPKDAIRVFFSDVVVPVLPTGRTLSNAFEALGNEGTWKPGARLPIKVLYRSMDGARYEEPGELLLHDDDGFAQTSWKSPAERTIGHHSIALAEDDRKLLERFVAQQRHAGQGKA